MKITPLSVNLFILVFVVGISLYLVNAVHPPAISASLAFILSEQTILQLLYLFITIIALFILIRLITYTLSQHLTLKKFLHEFKRKFD